MIDKLLEFNKVYESIHAGKDKNVKFFISKTWCPNSKLERYNLPLMLRKKLYLMFSKLLKACCLIHNFSSYWSIGFMLVHFTQQKLNSQNLHHFSSWLYGLKVKTIRLITLRFQVRTLPWVSKKSVLLEKTSFFFLFFQKSNSTI